MPIFSCSTTFALRGNGGLLWLPVYNMTEWTVVPEHEMTYDHHKYPIQEGDPVQKQTKGATEGKADFKPKATKGDTYGSCMNSQHFF